MKNLDLLTLKLFVGVCEEGSITRVSDSASIVGSAISKRLAQLEHTMGTPLLVRRKRGLEPTPAGETLAEYARGMLASAERMESEMGAYASGVKGQVRVLATTSMMMGALPSDIAAFMDMPEHRDIQVNMEQRMSPELVQGLLEGSAALGFCWDAADLTGLQTRTYLHEHLAVAMHAGHPLARRKTLKFEQTLEHPQVGLPPGSAMQKVLWRAAAATGKVLVPRVVVSTFDSALRVAQARLAIAVVPQEAAQPYVSVYGLKLVPLSDEWAERRIAICYRDDRSLSRAAKRLVEHLALD